MTKTNSVAAFLLCAVTAGGCMQADPESGSGAAVPERITQLFNGKNLDGWYTFLNGKGRDNDPGKVFKVEDGFLKISGREYGCITTEKEYRDYHLVVEYRFTGWVDEERKAKKIPPDSGILFHSTGPDGAFYGTWMASLEANLLYPGAGDFWTVAPKERTDITLTCRVGGKREHSWSPYRYSPKSKETVTLSGNKQVIRWGVAKEFKYPEWNVCELICDGDKAKVILNGRTVNIAEKVTPSAGRIQIQSEGSEVEFRKIEIRPIKRDLRHYLGQINAIKDKHVDRRSGLQSAGALEANDYIEKLIADRERLMLTNGEVAELWVNYATRGVALYRDDVFLKGYENALKENPEIVKHEMFAARLVPHYRLLKEIASFPKKEKELNFGQTLKSMGVKEKKTVHLKDHWNPTNMTAVIQGFVNDTNVTTIVFDRMPTPYYVFSVNFGPDVNGKRLLIKSGVKVQRVPWELRHLRTFWLRGAMFAVKGAKNLIIESDAADPREAVITFYDSREARLKVNRREGDSCISIAGGKRRTDTSINVVVRNLHLRDSEQDGIVIGDLWRPPEEIYIENVVMDSNFRQGTSPCTYYSLYFRDCEFINTRGGPPSAGCDVEPTADYLCTGILYFFDCKFANNDGGGLEFATSTRNPLLCYVKNCDFLPTPGSQFNITARPTGYITAGRRPHSDIIFEDCRFDSLGSSITFNPCPIYNTTFRNLVIRDARTAAAKAAAKIGPPPIRVTLNRDFGIPELKGELKAEIKFENVRIDGFENSVPLGVSDELGKLSIRNVFSGVVDWNGKKVDFSKVSYDAPDLNEPKTAYVDLKKLKKPAKTAKPDETMDESNAVLCYMGAWWISEPQHSYYFYAEKGREISFDFTLSYSRFIKDRPLKTLHIVGPSGEAMKFAEITEGTKRLSYKARETGWHRFSPGEDIVPKNMLVSSGGHWFVSGVKGTRFAWQADTKSDCFAKFQLKDKKKPYTGYFEVPAGGKECRIRVSYGGFELYDPAGNLVDKVGARDYMGRYVFTIKPSTDKAEIWSFRTPCTRAGGGVRALRFYAPLNGIWADSPDALPLEYTDHFVPEKKAVLSGKVAVRKIDRAILSAEQKAKLDATIAARKEFARKKVNTRLVPALEAQIAKMESGNRDDDTEKQLSDLRRGLDLVKRAAEMEAKAATEASDVAEAAAFVQAFADLLGPDKTTFGAAFPKDVVEYEYPVDLNPTIDAITAVLKASK